ncbi:MAG: RsmB/NOP family class I SAM-dependent RNA methyltransferase [Lentisphaeria bacterium]|nr:RsmB/NOP family class I SAM-dependent RNA methyltransferase [Lentisphaeria bacterium]
MELAEKKSKAQFHLLLSAARHVLTGMFSKKNPADRELADFYRRNRQCGSRDRALINTALYILLRHWGWVRKLAGTEITAKIEAGDAALSNRDLAALICFALLCDGTEKEKIKQAADFLELSCPVLRPALSRCERAAEAAKLFGFDLSFETGDLLPEWTRGKVPENYAQNILNRPPMWLRVNAGAEQETDRELLEAGLRYSTLETFPDARALAPRSINVTALESFQKGRFEIQDLASQAIVRFCAPRKGERWFDPCAGAGGKTLAIAEAMGRTGTVLAGDIREKVLLELRKRARRAGYPNIQTRLHDGKPHRGLKPFDGVLIDAPCTCSGVWRRNPGNPWLLTEEMVAQHAQLQLEILTSFSSCVKPGGRVIYATCSAFEQENEEVVKAFLKKDDRFILKPAVDPFTGKEGTGFLHIPQNHDCDLMFAAALERIK